MKIFLQINAVCVNNLFVVFSKFLQLSTPVNFFDIRKAKKDIAIMVNERLYWIKIGIFLTNNVLYILIRNIIMNTYCVWKVFKSQQNYTLYYKINTGEYPTISKYR